MPEGKTPQWVWLLIGILILTVIVAGLWKGGFFAAPPVEKVSQGILVVFQVYDETLLTQVTSNIAVEFFASGIDPIGVRTFSEKSIRAATYDSTLGSWKATLDAGNYVALIRDTQGSPTRYAEVHTVTVSPTININEAGYPTVTLSPSELRVSTRATPESSKAILAYNATAGTYSVSVANIDLSDYDKWLETFTFTISDAGTSAIIKDGRIYLTKITGLIPITALMDGEELAVGEDTDGGDDGITGYYIDYIGDWEVGELHRLDIYWEDQSASTGTLTCTLFEYYACLRTSPTSLRFWTPSTVATTVQT